MTETEFFKIVFPVIPQEVLEKTITQVNKFGARLDCLRCEKHILMPIEEVQEFVSFAKDAKVIVNGGAFVFDDEGKTVAQYLYTK